MKTTPSFRSLSVALAWILTSSFAQAASKEIYCSEDATADIRAWLVTVDSDQAVVNGWSPTFGTAQDLKLARNKAVTANRLPFGVFEHSAKLDDVRLVIESLVMVGSEPFERYQGAVSFGDKNEPIHCYAAK